MAKMKISVVLTVFNEISSILNTLDALKHQTLLADEIVIVDGGSTDGTWELLKKQTKIRCFREKCNRSVGRNLAIKKSKYPILAITDAGCIPEKTWLEELVKPLKDQSVSVVSGYYKGMPKNIFEKCQIPYVLVMPDKAEKSEFFPSTRSMAIRKSVFEKIGGFDPNLNYGEDYALAHKLKRLGYSFIFAKNAIVDWCPRKNLSETFWMFLFFAIGDIKAGMFRPKAKLVCARYLIFTFIFFMLLELKTSYIIHYTLVSIVIYYFWSVLKNYRYIHDVRAFVWLPVLQLTADIAVILGTIIGMLSRQWVIPKQPPKVSRG